MEKKLVYNMLGAHFCVNLIDIHDLQRVFDRFPVIPVVDG